MPRSARKKCENQVYHIMMRGNNREKIFVDKEDKSRIIDILEDKKKDKEFFLYAYCIMNNHIHIIIKEGKDPIARIVKRIAASYSYYYNKKYKRIGHVFQERYRSENIDDDSYLLTAIRYVHQNPLKAGIGTVHGYHWSSYRDYMGRTGKITDIGEILGMVSNSRKKALTEFARFNHEAAGETFLDVEDNKECDRNNITDYIHLFLEEKELEMGDLKDSANKMAREELIKLLLEKYHFSRRGIANILGLNREVVRRDVLSRDLSP